MKMASGGGTPSRWGVRVIPEVFDPVRSRLSGRQGPKRERDRVHSASRTTTCRVRGTSCRTTRPTPKWIGARPTKTRPPAVGPSAAMRRWVPGRLAGPGSQVREQPPLKGQAGIVPAARSGRDADAGGGVAPVDDGEGGLGGWGL